MLSEYVCACGLCQHQPGDLRSSRTHRLCFRLHAASSTPPAAGAREGQHSRESQVDTPQSLRTISRARGALPCARRAAPTSGPSRPRTRRGVGVSARRTLLELGQPFWNAAVRAHRHGAGFSRARAARLPPPAVSSPGFFAGAGELLAVEGGRARAAPHPLKGRRRLTLRDTSGMVEIPGEIAMA